MRKFDQKKMTTTTITRRAGADVWRGREGGNPPLKYQRQMYGAGGKVVMPPPLSQAAEQCFSLLYE